MLIEKLESRLFLSVDVAGFEWSMPPTYGVDENDNGIVDTNSATSTGWVASGRYPVEFSYAFDTAARMSCTFDGPNYPAGDPLTLSEAGRKLHAYLPEGVYNVTMAAYDVDGVQVSSETERIVINNILFVSIGDSFASGEGNPERPMPFDIIGLAPIGPATWADDPLQPSSFTHRSSLSAPSRAAIALEAADPHTSVTFLSLAESGAQITGDREKNVMPGSLTPGKSQLERVREIVGDTTIDVLTISAGGNDIGFGPAIQILIKNFNDPSDMPSLGGFASLASRYAQLDDWIDTHLSVRDIYLTQYPDLLRDGSGQLPLNEANDIGFGIPGLEISRYEAEWAETNLLSRLNSIGKAAAAAAQNDAYVPAVLRQTNPSVGRQWHYVDGLVEKFRTHGYPALGGDEHSALPSVFGTSQRYDWQYQGPAAASVARWVRTADESRGLEEIGADSKGIFHPNNLGQQAIADEILRSIANHPLPKPIADTAGPYNVLAGSSITLTAAAAFPNDPRRQNAAIYTWDLDGDGIYGEIASTSFGNEIGRMVTLSTSVLSGGQSRVVNVHVYDPVDNTEAYGSGAVAVDPAPPNARIASSTTAEENVPYTLAFDVISSGIAREHYITQLTINWGDGSTQSIPVAGTAQYVDLGNGSWADRFLIPHTFTQRNATRTVKVTALEELYNNGGTKSWGPFTANISVSAPAGYTASIAGRVVNDDYPDGAFTTTATAGTGWHSDSPLSVPVYIDSNDNGFRDLGERWAQPDGDGYYLISSVAPGSYRVRVDTSNLFLGYSGIFYTRPGEAGLVETVASSAVTGVDFWLTGAVPIRAIIDGSDDKNGNGAIDPDERKGAVAVPVLFDLNGNRRADAGESIVNTNELGYADLFLFDSNNSDAYSTVPFLAGTGFEPQPDDVLPNGSFENAFDQAQYWSYAGDPYGVPSGYAGFGSPTDGDTFKFMSSVTSDSKVSASASTIAGTLGLTTSDLNALGDPGQSAIEGESASRSIYAHAGSTILFDWNFVTGESAATRDFAVAVLAGNGRQIIVPLADTAGTLNAGTEGPYARSSGWHRGALNVPADGTYTLGFAVLDERVSTGDSGLMLDNVQLVGMPPSLPYDPYVSGFNTFEVTTGTAAARGAIFSDDDGDGTRGASEPGLYGVNVRLVSPGADRIPGTGDDTVVGTTTTDPEGTYSFAGVPAGLYCVSVDAIAGYDFTTPNVGPNELLDSDVDPATHLSTPFAVRARDIDATTAGGLRPNTVGLLLDSAAGGTSLHTTESGGQAMLNVTLRVKPTADVTATFWSDAVREGHIVGGASLVFTPSNWNVPQTITVAGVDDDVFDGTVGYAVQVDLLVSSDPRYDALATAAFGADNVDNEAPLSPDSNDGAGEANDTPATATPIGLSSADSYLTDQRIWKAGDEDWFRYTVPQDGELEARLGFANALGDLNLAIYDGDTTDPSLVPPLAISDGYGVDAEHATCDVVQGHTYLVRVYARVKDTNPQYSLAVVLRPAWLAPDSAATWDAVTKTLTVTGAATIVADPGADAPLIVGNTAAANLTINPTSGSQVNVGGITLSNGAKASLTDAASARALVINAGGLNLSGGGSLDLSDNAMIVRTGGLAAVQPLIATGFNHGAWDGAGGIISSTAGTDPAHATALGFATNASLNKTSFAGVTGLTGSDVLVKYTYAGDANLDGQVDIGDLGLLAGAWQQSGKSWFDGDFTYDGTVDIGDLGLLAGNWQKGVGNPI